MSRLFTTGIPVVGVDMVGRNNEKNQIKRLLKNGQSVIIYAPRRMGKTSLALTVLNELKREGYFIGHTDIFGTATLPILAQRILETTLDNKKLEKIIKALKEINIYRTLNSLVQKGILKKASKGDYQFTDPLLAEYIKRLFN